MSQFGRLWTLVVLGVGCLAGSGCGTTRLTDTARSASEEMLLSHSIDQAVGQLNFQVLAGQVVFLEVSHLGDVQFRGYLTGALRQHLLASGARLVTEPDQAEVIVEARAGSVATARHDSLVGIPQTTIPTPLLGMPFTIPEVGIIKKATHIGVAKVGVFAYRQSDGAGIWQSGMQQSQSVSRSHWYLGVGPFLAGDVVLDGCPQPGDEFTKHSSATQPSSLELEIWLGDVPVPGPSVAGGRISPWPADEQGESQAETESLESFQVTPSPEWQALPAPVVIDKRPVPLARPSTKAAPRP